MAGATGVAEIGARDESVAARRPTAARGSGRGPRGVAVIGATGSIGRSALEVIGRHPERLRAVALAADTRWEDLAAAAVACRAEAVALRDPEAANRARARLAGSGVQVLDGDAGVREVAAWPSAEVTLGAPTGVVGLGPVLAAVEAGKDIALANKESLVAGGRLVTAAALRSGVRLLPVDSEHSAVFQCLHGRQEAGLARIWLTASGGPFRDWPAERAASAKPAQALRHPTWHMGPRITVDCATLMNKGFEVIEATWLFGLDASAVRVVVHPQSVVHAFVEFVDGAVLAQCAQPDMRLPIAYALTYPERWTQAAGQPAPDLTALGRLDFGPPDLERFPCLGLAYAAAASGGTAPAALNAADEVAVRRFLDGDIAFGDIPRLCDWVLDRHRPADDGTLEGVLAADAEARALAREWRPRAVQPAAAAREAHAAAAEGGAQP